MTGHLVPAETNASTAHIPLSIKSETRAWMVLFTFRIALPSHEVCLLGDSKSKSNHHKQNSGQDG